jgi:hypothetical protein
MISIYLLLALVVAAILLGLIYIYEYRHRLDPAPKPCWPPTCNTDVEAKINELMKAVCLLNKEAEVFEAKLRFLTENCVFKKGKKNVD